MDRSNIDKIASTAEERVLLAKLWDKIHAGIRRNIPASTGFLSPREQEMARYLFGEDPCLIYFGGYNDSERNTLSYVPAYLQEDWLYSEESPIVCLSATFHEDDALSHRDFLGGLMACGVARETLGDICVGVGRCDFFVTRQIAEYIQQNFISAGRVKLHIEAIDLADAVIPEAEYKEIKDTVASLRLDSIISTGFRIGRSQASQYISAGKASIDGLLCEKPDKTVSEGMKISVRGLGKIKINSVNGQTKKDRIWVVIHRYI